MSDTLRGHEIYSIKGRFWYSDTKTPTINNPRPCGHCHKPDRLDGHDACLGELQGVRNACCGHGDTMGAYVQFNDKSRLGGKEAEKWIKENSS